MTTCQHCRPTEAPPATVLIDGTWCCERCAAIILAEATEPCIDCGTSDDASTLCDDHDRQRDAESCRVCGHAYSPATVVELCPDCTEATRADTVCIGWDGASRPILRYRADMTLPDHQRRTVALEDR
jgi:hypothetical protein